MDAMLEFRSAIAATGLTPPDHITPGEIVRFPGLNKGPSNRSAWCKLFEDGLGGVFGDYSSSISSTWHASRDKKLTEADKRAFEQKAQAARHEREQQHAIDQARSASMAKKRWDEATPCESFQYLQAKSVRSYGLRKEVGGDLIIPICTSTGEIVSLQTIDTNGQKRFLQDGAKKGNYFLIGQPEKQIVVCEGYATGASIFEATGIAVAVAFDAGNLELVAKGLASRYADTKLILAADDDYAKPMNTGLTKARDAALAVGGLLAIPCFTSERKPDAKDFNDLHAAEGLDAVKRCFSSVSLTDPAILWAAPREILPYMTSEPYPLHALPQTAREAVDEVQGFVKSPVALVACSALASISVVCQAHIDVERAFGLVGPTSLFLMAIASSGERKSSSDGYMTAPIKEYDIEQATLMREEIKHYKAEQAAWQAKHDGIVSKIRSLKGKSLSTDSLEKDLLSLQKKEPERPRFPHLLIGDATPEGLAIALTQEWPTGGIFSSEAGVILGSHGMSSDSAMRNLGLLNVLWDGSTHRITRRTSEPIEIRGLRLTMAMQTQEQTLKEFFTKTNGLARGIGFLARFLVTFPDSTQGTRMFSEAPRAWPKLAKFHGRIAEILNMPIPKTEDHTLTPKLMRLSVEAKQIWIEFHDAIETELRQDGELSDVRDVASKAADNAARLAALFQMFTNGIGDVSADAMKSATTIVAWHLHEARRLLPQLTIGSKDKNLIAVDQWLIRQCKQAGGTSVAKNDLRQKGPVRSANELDRVLSELVNLNRVRVIEKQRITIEVNPSLLGGRDGVA
jgi:putative DNA primase/helicase